MILPGWLSWKPDTLYIMRTPFYFWTTVLCVLAVSCGEGTKKYKILAVHSNKALTLSYNRPLQTVSDTGSVAYRWQIRHFPDATAQVLSLSTGQVIEVAEVRDRVLPYITDVDSSNMRQRFKIVANEDGSVTLVSVYLENYCIEIAEADTSDYAVITTCPGEDSPNQKWKISGNDSSMIFTSTLNGKYLAVTPPTNRAGANIGQWPFVGRKEQQWTLHKQRNGAYLVRNVFSGMYLQESDGRLSLKYNVQQHRAVTDSGASWYMVEAKEGAVSFRNLASGFCLDVRDGVPYNGANVMTFYCTGNDSQLWKVEEIP